MNINESNKEILVNQIISSITQHKQAFSARLESHLENIGKIEQILSASLSNFSKLSVPEIKLRNVLNEISLSVDEESKLFREVIQISQLGLKYINNSLQIDLSDSSLLTPLLQDFFTIDPHQLRLIKELIKKESWMQPLELFQDYTLKEIIQYRCLYLLINDKQEKKEEIWNIFEFSHYLSWMTDNSLFNQAISHLLLDHKCLYIKDLKIIRLLVGCKSALNRTIGDILTSEDKTSIRSLIPSCTVDSSTKQALENVGVIFKFYQNQADVLIKDYKNLKKAMEINKANLKNLFIQKEEKKRIHHVGKTRLCLNKNDIKLQGEDGVNLFIHILDRLARFHEIRFLSLIRGFNDLIHKTAEIKALGLVIDSFIQQIEQYQTYSNSKIREAFDLLQTWLFALLSLENSSEVEVGVILYTKVSCQGLIEKFNYYQTLNQCLSVATCHLQALSFICKTTDDQKGDWTISIDLIDDFKSNSIPPNSAQTKETDKKRKGRAVHKKATIPQERETSQSSEEEVVILPLSIQPSIHQDIQQLQQQELINRLQVIGQQKNLNSEDLLSGVFLLGQLSSLYEEQIRRMQNSSRSQIKSSLDSYVRFRFVTSHQEMRDHIFMGNCGFEMLIRSLLENDLMALAGIMPMLILDWAIQLEQYELGQYIIKSDKIFYSHNLKDLSHLSGSWDFLPLSIQKHLEQHDYGLIWSRYPFASLHNLSNSNRPIPFALQHLLFSQKLAQKIEKGEGGILDEATVKSLQELVQYAMQAQRDSQSALKHMLKDCLSPEEFSFFHQASRAAEQFSQAIEHVLLEKVKALTGKKYQRCQFGTKQADSQINTLLNIYQENLQAIEKAQSSYAPMTTLQFGDHLPILEDVKGHLLRLQVALRLASSYSEPHLVAWHFRNGLNAQWVFELLYMSQCLFHHIGFIQTHDFAIFQDLLNIEHFQSKSYPVPKDLNVGIGVHYPYLVGKTKDLPLIQKLQNLTRHSRNSTAKIDDLEEIKNLFQRIAIYIQKEVEKSIQALEASCKT